MALNDYAALQSKIIEYAEEISVDEPIADFIALAEVELNVILKHYRMETEAVLTSTANAVELPDDFLEARLIEVDGKMAVRVSIYGDVLNFDEIGYYQVGNTYKIVPEQDEPRTVRLVYYRSLTPLSDANPTNWLLTKFPNVYLRASLVQGYKYFDNPRMEASEQAALDKALALVDADHRRAFNSGNTIIFDGGMA
ncbi:hypothetical protein [Neorhizobium sp. T7_12]|uniref:phage adaptor protein n=1 Tax=Neorhizobium sp. T7_12 TaxID=2093832 RepID=UPI000CF958BD|nr:hypothetical protein [Neorhizobium sp. T7_12]